MRLFRLFGIDVTASWTWLVLFATIVYAATLTFATLVPGLSVAATWMLALLAALLSIASLYAHELAHALVAIRHGVPVRSIGLFLLGGLTYVARDSPSPRAELLIALAGPAVSLAIGAAGLALSAAAGRAAPMVGAVGLWLALMNLPLAVLNLVPAYPLDGGRVLRAVLWFAGQDLRWASAIAARAGQTGAAALLFAGLYALVAGVGSGLGGVWLLLIAWFMFAGATTAHRTVVFAESLRSLPVAAVMFRNVGRVEAGASLQAMAEEHLLRTARDRYPPGLAVYRDERLVGVVGMQHLRQFPTARWGSVAVERAMVPIERLPCLLPDASALAALHLVVDDGWDVVAVMAEERLLGLIGRAELAGAVEPGRGRR